MEKVVGLYRYEYEIQFLLIHSPSLTAFVVILDFGF